MVNYCKSHNDEYGTIDLLPFMEPMDTRPLLNGHIVSVNSKQFRVEMYEWNDGGQRRIGCQRHVLLFKDDFVVAPKQTCCYVFIDITMGGSKSKTFAKTPAYVKDAIKENKIKIINTVYPIWK